MVKIKQQLIKDTPYKYGRDNGRKFLSLHETANDHKGADAQAHADLQSKGNSREAAWHWSVDDKQAIQSFTHDFQLWHAGDGRHDGNLNSIAIEICVNADGNYQKAVQNAQELARHIMREENIPVSRVVQHHHWSGKDCPRHMRSGKHGVTWAEFIDGLRDQHKTRNKGKYTKVKGLNETSIVDFLKLNSIDASFSHRKKLAREHGIDHYSGTAQQNTALLNIMKHELSKSHHHIQKKKYPHGQDETSIIDFLKKNNQDASFKHRAKLAKKHGIPNYQGTAQQNIALLNILKNL